MFLENVLDSGYMAIAIWQFIVIIIMVIIGSGVGAFFLARKFMEKQIKKNPPVSEAMIRAMFQQMGRTPSEKQVHAVLKSMDDAKEKDEAKKKALKDKEEKKAIREQRKKEEK